MTTKIKLITKRFRIVLVALAISIMGCGEKINYKPVTQQLKVHESGRFLVKENGDPFFWLGDTGWRIFGDMDREAVDRYFADRVSKGFNVIQCQILHFDLDGKNAYGYKAMEDRDINRLVEDYWQHADYIINKAGEMGLYLAIVPALGKKLIEPKWRGDPADVIFATDIAGAYTYGKFLGNRYADMKNLIWVMGGDTWGYNDTIYYSIAKGIADGVADGDFDNVLDYLSPQRWNIQASGNIFRRILSSQRMA